jgi:hypothetical protein
MTTNELMTMVKEADPVSPSAFHDWADTNEGRAVAERIVDTPGQPARQRAHLWTRPSMVAGATAVLLILGAYGVVSIDEPSDDRSGPGGRATWGAPLVAIAQKAPRMLITEDGWHVVRADEFSSKYGGMTFAKGSSTVDLGWLPAVDHGLVVKDRQGSAEASWDLDLAGEVATVIQYEGTTVFTAVWRDGKHSLELSGTFPTVDEFRAVASTLTAVDVDTWLSAMPDSVVKPQGRAESVDKMVADIPMHPSVNLDKLRASELVSDRYQLGAKVTSAVACAWIDQWVTARAAGDDQRARQAVDAMATSRDWAILQEMSAEGGWSDVLWEYADAMPDNGSVSGGRPLTIEESYESALGCDTNR